MAIIIGEEDTDRASNEIYGYTYLALDNPCVGAGNITSVRVYSATATIEGMRVGTFYNTSGTTYKCRATAALGNTDARQYEWTGLSIAYQDGDLIGCYFTAGYIERDAVGFAGTLEYNGEAIDVDDEVEYTLNSGDAISLEGTGEVAGWANIASLRQGTGEIASADIANIRIGTGSIAVADIAKIGGVAV